MKIVYGVVSVILLGGIIFFCYKMFYLPYAQAQEVLKEKQTIVTKTHPFTKVVKK